MTSRDLAASMQKQGLMGWCHLGHVPLHSNPVNREEYSLTLTN